MSNYREMTSHQMTSHQQRSPRRRRAVTYSVPAVGQRLPLDLQYVVQEEDPQTGQLGTPMAKIRYDAESDTWKLIPKQQAGMYVFFNTEPGPEHKEFVITRLIPSGTACYADPA